MTCAYRSCGPPVNCSPVTWNPPPSSTCWHAGAPGLNASASPQFVKTAATVRKHHDVIVAAIEHGLANGRHEGLNKVRLIIRRVYGFHSPEAALVLIMLTCGPTNLSSHAKREVIHIHDR